MAPFLTQLVSKCQDDPGLRRVKANSTVMVPRNPAFRQKAPGIRGGVWGEAPRFFLFLFYFFPVKIT
jgi:hypothetical protein